MLLEQWEEGGDYWLNNTLIVLNQYFIYVNKHGNLRRIEVYFAKGLGLNLKAKGQENHRKVSM